MTNSILQFEVVYWPAITVIVYHLCCTVSAS